MKKNHYYSICITLLVSVSILIAEGCGKNDGIPSDKVPLVETGGVTFITKDSAYIAADVAMDNGYTVTARGLCWSTEINPTIKDAHTVDGAGVGVYFGQLTGLMGDTRYYARAYATNAAGTSYGSAVSFVTAPAELAVVITDSLRNITTVSAHVGGIILSNGASEIFDKGICWAKQENPTTDFWKISSGKGEGAITADITGLEINTLYYVRAYVINSKGTSYSEQLLFRTLPVYTGVVTDVDGNVYNTIKIGFQTWMTENLKTIHYNDGTEVPLIEDAGTWNNVLTPGYCWYNSNIDNKDKFGALYNLYAVNTGKLAPAGWHVPSIADWQELVNFLGGVSLAGNMLVEGVYNSSAFSARLSGKRNWDGRFGEAGTEACYWSTSLQNADWLMYWDLSLREYQSSSYVDASFKGDYRNCGFSVRCVKD